MRRDVFYFTALPHTIIRGIETSTGEYTAQHHEFVQCIGRGKTPAAAEASLRIAKFTLIQNMIALGLPIPTPFKEHDDTKSKIVWDAAITSLLAALDSKGVVITIDGAEDMLTLAELIAESIETGRKLKNIPEAQDPLKKTARKKSKKRTVAA